MIKRVEAKSVLRRHRKIDAWFISHYGMNIYRGCSHNCSYCDGRAERYRVEGDYASDIEVKVNAAEILDRELNPKRKRKPMPRSFIVLGGGVCDIYQGIEKKERLTRSVLEVIEKWERPAHLLTKSALVERDIDILKRINEKQKVLVSFSFSSADDNISRIFEPGASPPSERIRAMSRLKKAGISSGIFLMPVLPLITDTAEMMAHTLQETKTAGAEYVMFGGMTLKAGRQRDWYMNVLGRHYPDLVPRYENIYADAGEYGSPDVRYTDYVHKLFESVSSKTGLPRRIPASFFRDIVSRDDLILVILEQLDYLSKLQKRNSLYGYAAYNLSKLDGLAEMPRDQLLKVRGVGNFTADIISEIQKSGSSEYYESLL